MAEWKLAWLDASCTQVEGRAQKYTTGQNGALPVVLFVLITTLQTNENVWRFTSEWNHSWAMRRGVDTVT